MGRRGWLLQGSEGIFPPPSPLALGPGVQEGTWPWMGPSSGGGPRPMPVCVLGEAGRAGGGDRQGLKVPIYSHRGEQ